jgi:hypothetical protein
MASLYFFYFVLLGISCVLFVAEFKRWPFALFLLSAYLAGLFFLQNYVQTQREQLATLANSRVFEALSLLPATHIFLLVWRGPPFRMGTIATAAGQATLLAFLVECRTTALWQVAMIIAAAATVILATAVGWHSSSASRKGQVVAALWPTAIAVALLTMGTIAIDLRVDPRYSAEPKAHVIWHEVLRGILSTNLELQQIYVGKVTELGDPTDQIAYDAVMKDLNDRHDRNSPIAFNVDGRIYIDPDRSYAEYDRLAQSLSSRIIADHPFKVIASIPEKVSEQIDFFNGFTLHSAMRVDNLLIAALVAALAGVLWLGAKTGEMLVRDIVSGTTAAAIVLACALVPPLIAPSNLSVGTLLCFLIAPVVGAFVLLGLAVRLAQAILVQVPSPQGAGANATREP